MDTVRGGGITTSVVLYLVSSCHKLQFPWECASVCDSKYNAVHSDDSSSPLRRPLKFHAQLFSHLTSFLFLSFQWLIPFLAISRCEKRAAAYSHVSGRSCLRKRARPAAAEVFSQGIITLCQPAVFFVRLRPRPTAARFSHFRATWRLYSSPCRRTIITSHFNS